MSEQRKKRGDHPDGRLIKDIDAFHIYFANLAPRKSTTEVWLKESVDVTDLLQYIRNKNLNNPTYKTTVFHAMLTVIAKTVHHRPYLNRFIRNGKYYQRNNILLSFVAKQKFNDEASEALVCLKIDKDMTMGDISSKVINDVSQARKSGGNEADDILNTITKLPGFLLRIIMRVIHLLDRYGKLPKFFYEIDPNFSSVLVSNLGSIKIDAPYHHLNDFGSNSVMITIGEIHKQSVVNEDNETVIRDVVNIGITLDERIADGYYFAKSVRLFKQMIKNPSCLDLPIETPIDF